MHIRLLDIFKNKEEEPRTNNSTGATYHHDNRLLGRQHRRRHKQTTQQQLELETLGTIELNSYDELKYNIDDDVDDNHGLSSCGSAMQYKQIGGSDDSRSDIYCSFASSCSRSFTTNETKDIEGQKDEIIPKECDVQLKVGKKEDECPVHDNNIHEEQKITIHDEQIISLFQTGKELYANGSYKHALSVQKDALKLVQRKGSSAERDTENLSLQHDRKFVDAHLYQRQKSMIKYEIAKIKFVICKEHSYKNSLDTDDDDAQSRLSYYFDKMQDAKCKISLQDLNYYQNLLAQLESDYMNKHQEKTKLPFDQGFICQKIEIFHVLGKTCQKHLHKYEDALRYYKVALELECYVLNHLLRRSSDCDDNKEIQDEIDEWKINIRQTKQKIGAIHYLNGRFGMALLSSFSCT